MFWLHERDLPAGVGSEPFCAAHLAYLACFLLASVGYALLFRRLDPRRRKTADRILGSLVLFFGLFEYGVTALVGHFSLYTLPLHICSLMFLLVPLHAWTGTARPGSFADRLHAFLGAVIFHPGVPGVWAALLFPDWLRYPFWNYLSISGFLVHGLISVYGMSILVHGAETPDRAGLFRREFRASVLFLIVGAALMYCFDRATGTNYWFMAGPSADSPFLGVWQRGGYGAYLLALSLAAAAVTAIWYGLRYLLFVRKQFPKSQASNK